VTQIYSQLLGSGYSSAAGNAVIITPGPDRVTVVRSISLAHQESTARKLGAQLVAPGGVYAWLVLMPAVAAWQTVVWEGYIVIPYGYHLDAWSDTGGIRWVAGGFSFDAV